MYIDLSVIFLFSTGVFMIFSKNNISVKNRIMISKNHINEFFVERIGKFSNELKLKKKKSNIENEIYQSASLLENIIILQKDNPKGAAYIIEQIASYSRELKNPFDKMIYFMRMNQNERAVEAFAKAAGTRSAAEYGDILIKMDVINPSELRENISLLRRRLREENITREKRKNEVVSDLIYIPVLANVMLIFVNFIYISYYAEQKELFQQLLF